MRVKFLYRYPKKVLLYLLIVFKLKKIKKIPLSGKFRYISGIIDGSLMIHLVYYLSFLSHSIMSRLSTENEYYCDFWQEI